MPSYLFHVPPRKVRAGLGGHIGFIVDPVDVGVGVGLTGQILIPTISFEPVDGIPLSLPGYIIGANI